VQYINLDTGLVLFSTVPTAPPAFTASTPPRSPRTWPARSPRPTSTATTDHRPANPDQASLFQLWRFHAFFTTSELDTVTADKTHRGHAIIEQVNADLKNSALAHMPSGKFMANSAWLACAVMAFNLTRTAGCLAGGQLAKATTPTLRARLIAVPARVASSARRLTLHLPRHWPWAQAWTTLFAQTCGPPLTTTS
jgi:hypothetical protein